MAKTKNFDAIIIGAGVIGNALALELTRLGRKTINVDMRPAAGYGSTSNSCAIIRVHYSTLEATAFAYDGYFYWKHWSDYLGYPPVDNLASFRETGCLAIKTDSNNHLKKVLANVEALSIPHEHWDAKDIVRRLPFYDLRCYGPPKPMNDSGFGEPSGGEITGGVFFPTAGYVNDPQLAAQNIQHAAQANGAQFLFRHKVVEIPRSDNRVQGVVLDDGTRFNAPVVVNVGGPHSAKLNQLARADAGMKISTRALRQEVAHVPAPDGFEFGEAGLVISDSDIGVYCRPEVGNHVLVGSEDPDCDLREWVDADNYNRDLTDQSTTQALRMAQRMGGLKLPNRVRGVVDLYDVSDDWLPIYDCSTIDGFYMACGTSGNQFKNAPVAGKLMAQLVNYCESGNNHDSRPLPFALCHIDFVLDTATMSRLREINPESSFSVLG